MKVRLTDIPKDGLKLSDTISLEALNQRMSEGAQNDIKFLSAPHADIQIQLERDSSSSGALLYGTVTTSYQQPCPRCLAPLKNEINETLSLLFKPANGREKDDDDIGIIYFDGEHIDLEDVLQETIILAVSPFGLTHEGCPGVVEYPKKIQEEETSNFGSLLKGALKEKP